MKILITGSAGFIGFNLAKKFLTKKNIKVFGIDNINNYYDVGLKKKRNNLLKKIKNYTFKKIDIRDNTKLEKIFKKEKFDFVFNLAAQAGVRYSIDHPREYVENNILGFYNIIENVKKYKIKRLFYASSSSVYGDNNNYPLNEKQKIYPKNMYALSKKINEEISSIFNEYYQVKMTGLRFFTVYGDWGRPDMMMVKFIDSYYKKKLFRLFNFGKHVRDFTYVEDVTNILYLLLRTHKKLPNNDILNICSNDPINLEEIIKFMNKNGITPKVKKVTLQKADILKTHGDNKKILKYVKYKKFTHWKAALKKTITWYQQNMI